MKHRVAGKKLNRTRNHRQALFKNLIRGLVANGHLTTTIAKAKAVQGHAEKLITKAKDGSLHQRRIIHSFLGENFTTNLLVDVIAPQLKNRTSGFTKITKLGERRGDSSMMVKLEFTDTISTAPTSTVTPSAKAKPPKAKSAKTKPTAKPAPKKAVKPAKPAAK